MLTLASRLAGRTVPVLDVRALIEDGNAQVRQLAEFQGREDTGRTGANDHDVDSIAHGLHP